MKARVSSLQIMTRYRSTTIILLIGFLLSFAGCKKDTGTGNLVDFTINIADPEYAVLQTIGGNITINSVLIIHTVQFTYAAVSPYCTNDNCPLNYNPSANQLNCPCDGSIFDINGFVLEGPAVFPLPIYKIELTGTLMRVYGPE